MRPVRSLRCVLLVVAAVAVTPTAPAHAQEVRGLALEAGSNRPIDGAFVTLVGETGSKVASALTGADGAFLLRAPRPGTYRLRVERIGYTSWTSDAFRAGYGPPVTRRLRVPVQAVSLAALSVDLEAVCGERGGAGPELARVWEEARKALEVTRWTERRTGIGFELRRWTRALEPETGRVLEEETFAGEKRAWRAFVSAPTEELSAEGYVRQAEDGSWRFFAPDAEVLLSDDFAADHCFSVVRGQAEEEGLVGLAFEPVPGRRASDVEGTLWLDPATAELRHLEFAYTNTRFRAPLHRYPAGGRVEFARLPTGHWFVRAWRVRMPVAGQRLTTELAAGPGGGPLQPGRRIVLARVREVGGEVVGAELPDERALELAAWGAVEGMVRDAAEAPAAAVEVELAGTAYRGRTDSGGRFRIAPVPPGEYTVRARSSGTELLGVSPTARPIAVHGDAVARVDLALPSLAAAAAELCREADLKAGGAGAIAFGFVRGAGGDLAPGARVWIADRAWALGEGAETPPAGPEGAGAGGALDPARAFGPDRADAAGVTVEADSAGAYLACGVPAGRALLAQAGTDAAASDTAGARADEGALLRLDFRLSEDRRPLARFDLPGEAPDLDAVVEEILAAGAEDEEPGTATLVGRVASAETGEPLPGARVRLLEAGEERVTGPDGTFVAADLPPGRYRVVAEHLGAPSDTAEVDLRYGSGQVIRFALETRPIELPALEVEVERPLRNPRLAGFYERMARGLGSYITREDLEEVDVIHNFRRRVPNIDIAPCVGPTGLRMSNCWNLRIARAGDGWGGSCPALVYVDGHLLSSPSDSVNDVHNAFSVLQKLPRDMLEGIEVYKNPGGAPAEYRALGDACGIVLVWTRGR